MANREKGEVEITVGTKTYILALDINAMAWLEDKYSTPEKEMSFAEIFERLETGKRIKDVRTMMLAAMQKHHPEATEIDAGNVMQAAGGLHGFSDELQAKIRALSVATRPDPADLKELGAQGNGNPRKAQPRARRGRGARSTSTASASV